MKQYILLVAVILLTQCVVCVLGATTQQVTFVGDNTTIDCPLVEVKLPGWVGPPEGLVYTLSGSPQINDLLPNYDRVSYAANNRDLVITAVQLSDGGDFTCFISEDGVYKSGLHTLIVRIRPQPPEISNTKTIAGVVSVQGTAGQTMTLVCISRGGHPAPTVSWYRQTVTSTPLASSDTGPAVADGFTVTVTYTFTPTRDKDGMEYICRSSFPDPNPEPVNTAVQLYLKYHPNTTVTTSATGPVTENMAGVITLQCSVHSKPAPTVTWYHDNVQNRSNNLSTVASDNTYADTYTIPQATRQDAGTYKCTATNTITLPASDTSNTASVNLVVYFPPLSTSIEGNVQMEANGQNKLQLTCTVDTSNPASNITWTTGTINISHVDVKVDVDGPYNGYNSSQRLVLTPTRDDDGDTVTCTADNTVGQSVPSLAKLDFTYNPIATIPVGDQNVTEGFTNMTLTCNASSKPPATFTWYNDTDNIKLGSGTGSQADNQWTYTIPKVDRSHSGWYKCNASNGVGSSDYKQMKLTVQYPPDVTAAGKVTGQTLAITCSPSGVPAVYSYSSWVHTWSDGQEISQLPGGSTLNRTGLTYQDSGVYTCRVSNGVALYGTNDDDVVREGSTSFITIGSHPIITSPVMADNEVQNISIRLRHPSSIDITYYSNADGNNVTCDRVNGSVSQTVCVVTTTTDTIQLNVYNSTVSTQGTKATVTLTINDTSELGSYQVHISNANGTKTIYMEAVPEEPPPGSSNIGAIAGAVGGCGLAIIVIVVIVVIFIRRRGSGVSGKPNKDVELMPNGSRQNVANDDEDSGDEEVDNLNYESAGAVGVAMAGRDLNANKPQLSGINPNEIYAMPDRNHAAPAATASTSGAASSGGGSSDVYAVVDKSKKSPPVNVDPNALYSVVDKSDLLKAGKAEEEKKEKKEKNKKDGKKEKKPKEKKGKADKKSKGAKPKKGATQATGTLYENATDVYENAQVMKTDEKGAENLYEDPEDTKPRLAPKPKPTRNVNEDGLLYVDIDFKDKDKDADRKLIIHGIDDTTDYADVEFGKVGAPCPESYSDEEKKAEKKEEKK